ncbi:MAG: hypothetical protein WCX73_05830 [Candidatus Pacearchaeota archaeon]|jgi:hypothetical protein
MTDTALTLFGLQLLLNLLYLFFRKIADNEEFDFWAILTNMVFTLIELISIKII